MQNCNMYNIFCHVPSKILVSLPKHNEKMCPIQSAATIRICRRKFGARSHITTRVVFEIALLLTYYRRVDNEVIK